MSIAEELRRLAENVAGYARVLGVCDQAKMGINAEETAKELRSLADRCAALEEPTCVKVAGVTDKNFYAGCYIAESDTTLFYGVENGQQVLYEYDVAGTEVRSMLASYHPKPAHWKPVLQSFGIG